MGTRPTRFNAGQAESALSPGQCASGHPALSVPCGMSPDGLPIGLQIVGRWHSEAQLLAVAAAIEALKPWAANWPALSGKEQHS